ncbi:MAG: hypothetical protein O2887_15240 [Bacteroidetes bacterium]|nr:hypothetical protein [Bacteroidota bacterium]MDA1121819.1 hypothetical protein [Bacteroidota bacterium]
MMRKYISDKMLRFGRLAILAGALFLIVANWSYGQDVDSVANKDAIFARPFIFQGNVSKQTTTAIGGYLEGNTNYFVTNGVGDGFSMEMRRFNIFLYSSISDRIRFLSELEFEHGTEEIALETALLDFELHPSFILRAGVILPPIGYFNQNHDGPKWEFIDRPLVSTTILPATLSEIGFGFHGNVPVKTLTVTYEVYLTNGLNDNVVANEINRTSLTSGKGGALFEEDNNGSPSLSSRIGFKSRKYGELGFSYYGGVYNTFKSDGLNLDVKRGLNVLAIDVNFQVSRLRIIGETAWINADIPQSFGQQFGSEQWGFHLDLIYPLSTFNLFSLERITLNGNFRIERVDYNIDNFNETGTKIFDEVTAIVPGLSLRFSRSTLIRANYRYHWERDFFGNPASKTGGFQFGFASYF